jgi:hypothetical protein
MKELAVGVGAGLRLIFVLVEPTLLFLVNLF